MPFLFRILRQLSAPELGHLLDGVFVAVPLVNRFPHLITSVYSPEASTTDRILQREVSDAQLWLIRAYRSCQKNSCSPLFPVLNSPAELGLISSARSTGKADGGPRDPGDIRPLHQQREHRGQREDPETEAAAHHLQQQMGGRADHLERRTDSRRNTETSATSCWSTPTSRCGWSTN